MNRPKTMLDIDTELVLQCDEAIREKRYFKAADLLKSVSDPSLLTPQHHRTLEIVQAAAVLKHDLLQDNPEKEGWKKQTEKHGNRDILIYYKVNPEDNSMRCRIDSPIESSLVLPLLSVLNESDLYKMWMPSYTFPVKLGVSESKMLKEMGQGQQIIQVKIDMPFPFHHRECIQEVHAFDCIAEDKAIFVTAHSMDTGQHYEMDISPVEKGYTRVDFEAAFFFRSCPLDHPSLAHSKHQYPDNEQLILVSLEEKIDAHVGGVHKSMINFFTRIVLAGQWIALLQVAEGIRDGKRPEHMKAMQERHELYDWVKQRLGCMLDGTNTEQQTSKEQG